MSYLFSVFSKKTLFFFSKNSRKSLLGLVAFALVASLIPLGAQAKTAAGEKRISKDPDSATVREAKVLGWGPVKAPNRGKVPEFLIRGVVLEVGNAPEQKGLNFVKILPIEVLNNHQRAIDFTHFENGYDIIMKVPSSKLKEIKKGRMLEFNQYYTEQVEQAIGGAKMVAMSLHQDIQGYPAGPGAYLKTPGFYPIQYKNAIRGAKISGDNLGGDNEIKANLDYLATKSPDPEIKTIAMSSYTEIFGGQPSGACNLDQQTKKVACR